VDQTTAARAEEVNHNKNMKSHLTLLTALLLAPLAAFRVLLWASAVCLMLCSVSVSAMVYQPPPGTSMWDTWMFCEGKGAHLFYLRSEVGR
jgi:hypothetical protein